MTGCRSDFAIILPSMSSIARLEDLRGDADERDIEQPRATLESAQANYDDLIAGPTVNAVEQQRQDVRLPSCLWMKPGRPSPT